MSSKPCPVKEKHTGVYNILKLVYLFSLDEFLLDWDQTLANEDLDSKREPK